ncbi:hypothetical protein [Streptomyces sp. 142MFCol3.1]|uniref:hypothetical protein n=1 Tax=Streptomyces sp. 142MFCol3.1 TaxID=1172179 RepID=UPI002D21DE1A|nr:hypothetical protein [Streptomyces sp. 142MFCol3.1]
MRDHRVGLAHSDTEVVELMRRSGMPFGPHLLDNPVRVRWNGAPAHTYCTS